MASLPAYEERFSDYCSLIDDRLEHLAPRLIANEPERVRQSMRYSLLGGGKRLRPLVTLLTTEALGGDVARAVDVACAIEMVHTASIIVDDLPSMDDAALRRGRKTNHHVFGEDIAILGAVALVAEAFGIVAAADVDADVKSHLCSSLSRAIGVDGLCAGQERDLRESAADVTSVEKLQLQKTGALFVFCLEAGARIAGLTGADLEPLRRFGRHAGMAFQVLDDLLDVVGTEAATGKGAGQDGDKDTAVSVMGLQGARRHADRELEDALAAIEATGIDAEPFAAFLDFVMLAFEHQVDVRRRQALR